MEDRSRTSPEVGLLMSYVDGLRSGERPDKGTVLLHCPVEKRADLRLAMTGADIVEQVARDVRVLVSPEARRRVLRNLRGRLAL